MRTLRLELRVPLFRKMGDNAVQALGCLKAAAALHTLHMDISHNDVGASGAQALSALKDAPSLHTLHVVLSSNRVGDAGAQALAALKGAPALQKLHLDLALNQVVYATPPPPPCPCPRRLCPAAMLQNRPLQRGRAPHPRQMPKKVCEPQLSLQFRASSSSFPFFPKIF